MGREGTGPDFIESLARGLEVIAAFGAQRPSMTLTEVAAATDLARPTARRILLTLTELGYVRSEARGFVLTPRVLELGVAYVGSLGLWDVARPHLEQLSARTGESCSIAQLDGSDIVYVARVAVPKLIALRVDIGTRFPVASTSLGKVLLAGLADDEVAAVLAIPSRSGVTARYSPEPAELAAELRLVREQGWALTDERLAAGIRSVAAPLTDGDGRVVAALNVTVHAAETSVEVLLGEHLPRLLTTAAAIAHDLAAHRAIPSVESRPDGGDHPRGRATARP